MIGAKPGAAGKRKRAKKCDRGGVAGVSGSGGGGSGVGCELGGVADGKFFGVQVKPPITEIKNYVDRFDFYETVKEGILEAAIIHDVARVYANPSYARLNILEFGLCNQKEAQIEQRSIRKRFLVEFTKRHPLKLDDWPDEVFPLKLKSLTKEQFEVLKEQIVEYGHECFRSIQKHSEACFRSMFQLKKEITGDRERHVQGRQKKDAEIIPDYLPEDDAQALKDQVAEVVAKFAPSNGKSLDAKGEGDKRAWITFLKDQLQKLEPEGAEDLDGLGDLNGLDLFVN